MSFFVRLMRLGRGGICDGGDRLIFKFGFWVFYLGWDGFYVERLGSVHVFVGFVDLRECRVES